MSITKTDGRHAFPRLPCPKKSEVALIHLVFMAHTKKYVNLEWRSEESLQRNHKDQLLNCIKRQPELHFQHVILLLLRYFQTKNGRNCTCSTTGKILTEVQEGLA